MCKFIEKKREKMKQIALVIALFGAGKCFISSYLNEIMKAIEKMLINALGLKNMMWKKIEEKRRTKLM